LGFLKEEGNPFQRIGVDPAGRTAIDFGVYGVPETFVVAGDGTIAYKFVGPLTPEAVTTTLLPAIQRAAQKAAPAATKTNTP
jgi:cytochrome c biogenesis protein CcmG/thiol:disulfide interchange protein DsbE